MFFPTLILTALAAASTPPSRSSLCGTTQMPDGFAKTIAGLSTMENSMKLKSRSVAARGALPLIDVTMHFHTVSSIDKKDSITMASLEAQFTVLRDVYAQYDVNIKWDGTMASKTVDDWLASGDWPITHENVAKKKDWLTGARKGGYTDLNIYFLTSMPEGFWGRATLPETGIIRSLNTTEFREDGCFIHADTLPGGPFANVNLGFTTVHEVGHWLGLLHVFMGYSCDGEGDLIDDTPITQIDSVGCPIGKDSCPDAPGLDPIHNFMDYSDDSCYNDFTEGQKIRMHALWNTVRKVEGNGTAPNSTVQFKLARNRPQRAKLY